MDSIFVFAVPIVGTIAVFTFLAITVWAAERRKEREAYYRYELGKKLAEKGNISEEKLAELLGGERKASFQRRREGAKLGGLITVGVGVGFLIGFRFIEDEAIWMLGWIPFAIGAAMLLYALVLAPKDDDEKKAGV